MPASVADFYQHFKCIHTILTTYTKHEPPPLRTGPWTTPVDPVHGPPLWTQSMDHYYFGDFVTQPWINTGSAFIIFVHGSVRSRHLSDRNLERQYSASKSLISSSSFSMFKLFYSRSPILLKHRTAKRSTKQWQEAM